MIPRSNVFPSLTRLHFAWQIEEWGWSIGPHTYGRPRVLEPELASLTIGDYCSIGPEVTIVLGNHRTDLVTTYPFQALGHFWPGDRGAEPDHDTRGQVVIENDVWIGAHATILSGVCIGSGAVIGAGALVKTDVAPYAIVAGNPARQVRRRFDDATVERLLAVAWWSWPQDQVRAWLPMILSPDITAFLGRVEAGEGPPPVADPPPATSSET